MSRKRNTISTVRKNVRRLRSQKKQPQSLGNDLTLEALEDRQMLTLSVPLLSSLPGAPVTIHLDFDGTPAFEFIDSEDEWASGPLPGDSDPIPAFSLDNDFLNYNSNEIAAIDGIWQYVSEIYSPFNINVTTDASVPPVGYPDGIAIHAIMGGRNSDWGDNSSTTLGVSREGAFTNDRPNSAFTFTGTIVANQNAGGATINQVTRHQIAGVAAHEIGHVLGLKHQSVVDSENNILVEYSSGDANTAPIMGGYGFASNVNKRGLWWNGPSSFRNGDDDLFYSGIQDDLAGITRPGNFVTYRPDNETLAINSTNGTASVNGVIEINGSTDDLAFNPIGPIVSFTVTSATFGAMLIPTLELIPLGASAAGNVTVTTTGNGATLTATNVTPGGGYLLRVRPQVGTYGNIGQYFVTGNVGSFASLTDGVITVEGFDSVPNDLKISYIASTDKIVLQDNVLGGAAIQQFPRSQVTSMTVEFRNSIVDTIDVFGQYSVLNIPITVEVGDGDRLVLQGTTGNDTMELFDRDRARLNNTFITISPGLLNVLEEIRLAGFAGDDHFSITTTDHPVTIIGDLGNDTITLGTGINDFNQITVPIRVFGGSGSDTLNLGNGNASAITADITFDGGVGGGGVVDAVNYNDGANISTVEYAVEYDVFSVAPRTVERNGFGSNWTLFYNNVSEIKIYAGSGHDFFTVGSDVAEIVRCYGNSGNDSMTYGDGVLLPLSGQQFNGGTGEDTLILDDHNNPSARTWQILTDRVIYAGTFVFGTSGFEGVSILAGNGADEFFMGPAVFTQTYTLDGGGGLDRMSISGARTASLTLRGGNDSDLDFFDIDDRNYPGNMIGGAVFADRISRETFPLQPSEIYYSGFTNVNWYLQATQNFVAVYGLASNFSVIGNSSNDYVEVYARDTQGNQTINGNLNFIGGGDADTMTLLSGNLPANYRFFDAFGTGSAYIEGAGSGWVVGAPTVESINTIGSPENDTFAVEKFKSGAALAIYGGNGDDSCTIGNGDMSANLTNAAAFTFDGQGDSDRFTIANHLTNTRWDYYTGDGFVRAARPATGYLWHSVTTNIESQYFLAGSEGDAFYLDVVSPGVYTECNGFGGIDGLGLGFATNNLETIQGPIVYDPGFDGGNIAAYDLADATGDVVHLDANSMGAYAGDTLFGSGGSLTFSNLVNFGAYPGITLSLGSGADTVFAQPLATARVDIHGNDPTSAPGDVLNLALGAAQNFVISAGSSGNVTSSNLQTLSWTEFEGPFGVDNVAPQIVDAAYENSPTPTVRYRFSENVSLSLNVGHLLLVNTTTGAQISSVVMNLSYDPGTNTARFTFPGMPNGVLPSGHYSATIASSVADAAGNQIGMTSPLLFNNIPNAAPVANPDSFTVSGAGVLSGNVLANDTDDNLPLSATLVNLPQHGTLILSPTGSFQYTPTLGFSGTDSFTYIATDALGASSLAATVTISVTPVTTATLVPDTCNPGKLALYVPGTAAADDIRIKPKDGSELLEVLVNGASQGTFSPTGRIIVRAGAGNDIVHIVDEVTKSAWLYGEAGKDNLKGGAGPDVILGGSGDDTINGGNGRDLLIGGLGADRIVGGGADDLLIAGRTTFDNNDLALNGILAEWNSSRSFVSRVANLRGTGNGVDFDNRLNGNYFLQTEGPSATVLDDGAVDVVSGTGGFDWYFANLDGSNIDKITDLTAMERVDDLD